MQYFYRPIAFYQGAVLKCAGICVEANKEWFSDYCNTKAEPTYSLGVVIVDGYRGDKISADTLQAV